MAVDQSTTSRWPVPETLASELSAKQTAFNAAMELFTSRRRYKLVGLAVSSMNVSLQACLLYRAWPQSIGAGWQVFSLLVAYLATDFVNGLVHMFMDNNDSYESFAGPLIANFHMHHKIPQYKKTNLLMVYFTETGSKVWLVGYLLAVLVVAVSGVDPIVVHILVYVGVLSSVAEVSHYLCHSSMSATWRFLGNSGVLLSKRHHAGHHLQDNRNYAFLNGVTDPLLNLVAATWCRGYKEKTDLHFACYAGAASRDR